MARRVAETLGYVYVDSGAMYRAFALKALRRGLMPAVAAAAPAAAYALTALAHETRVDLRAEDGALRVLLDGEDVTDAIRTREVTDASSRVSTIPGVREVMVAEQSRAGRDGGVVMEGRDIGTVVFPHADLKIYLTASADVRAERRWREHQQKGDAISLPGTLLEVRERDRRDRERKTSPLVRADDAVLVDSSAMEAEEAARLIVLLAGQKAKPASARK